MNGGERITFTSLNGEFRDTDFRYTYRFVNLNDNLHFIGNSNAYGNELHSFDQAIDTVRLIADINPGRKNGASLVSEEVTDQGFYYVGNDNKNGVELWFTDGRGIGTYMVEDIFPGIGSSYPNGFYQFDNYLYFSAQGVTGYELYRTKIGSHEAQLIADIHSEGYSSSPKNLFHYQGDLYFLARDTVGGQYELYQLDIDQLNSSASHIKGKRPSNYRSAS